ncbi:chitinase 18-8 [Cordyceps fumosorosea ARSEF 2679]|uniref:chitinase n=1 Tax=Cordyceps fumosorosea (strain ARSEF 2679) TaxID=1081104 RepID=A0A162I718_CORFA|nr:chitinase 18-8 [Cordyceps fumosorosea ARSEF 2679]OAA53155.1 chitinase 18-8 [Cordyceps fumosorosea ARSEF 2679]
MYNQLLHWPVWVSLSLSLIRPSFAVTNSYNGQYADDCPELCSRAGSSASNWTHIHRVKELSSCNQTILFRLNVQRLIDDPHTVITIQGCTVTGAQDAGSNLPTPQEAHSDGVDVAESPSCDAKTENMSAEPGLGGQSNHAGVGAAPNSNDVQHATNELSTFLRQASTCGESILFAKHLTAVVGMYSGAQVVRDSALHLLDMFHREYINGQPASLQVCSEEDAAKTFGVYAAGFPDISVPQDAVRAWANGQCINGSSPAASVDMGVLVASIKNSNMTSFSSSSTNSTVNARRSHTLLARGNCRTEQVKQGDSCASLADRCGISGNDITKYNTRSDFCSTLKPKQYYCCGPGDLPDMRPQPDPDGTCHVYPVAANDGCWAISDAFGVSKDDLETFNKKTWGWAGCGSLQLGQRICVSKGNPPMPAPVAGTTCGPQVPGTKKPTDGTDFAGLNPCPLNACCDVWGFCGTTAEFCTKTPADNGGPGTTQPGKSSCISNCGMDIVNNGQGPSSFEKLGYFEAFNVERKCLHMDASNIPTDKYTLIHFAFAGVTANFDVELGTVNGQFERFKGLKGPKKVLSFGGWAFSTDQATFQRFRQATNPANRGTFVNNLIGFLDKAPDIPDIEPGSPDEGDNYLGFLSLLRSRLPSSKTLSIALPASFWYLKQYPVKDIARYVDYFVYMTYDLHGQWDVGNKWAVPGCDGGNCLRSHVNKTETINALAMLTKAGVHSNQVLVGVSSYGRSFRMKDEHCSGPFCTFLGARGHSQAYEGRCTGTGGYISNAEIGEIIGKQQNYSVVQSFVDKDSGSNIAMYGEPGAVDWVAYMDGDMKTDRIDWIKQQNFRGFSDWAIDLESFTGDEDNSGDDGTYDPDDDDWDWDFDGDTACNDSPGSLQSIAHGIDGMKKKCASLYTLKALSGMIDESFELFGKNNKGYDEQFGHYATWVKENIDPKLDSFMAFGKGDGNEFFTCTWKVGRRVGSGPCRGMPHYWEEESTFTVEYKLSDEDGFYKAASEKLGIDKDWIAIGNRDKDYDCRTNVNEATQGRPGRGSGISPPCSKIFRRRMNVPVKAADDKIKVGNPKEMLSNIMPNIAALKDTLTSTYATVGLGIYDDTQDRADVMDAVVGYSLPVLQLSESVDSMKTIKGIGEKANADKKRNLILSIITYVLMALPFVGEAVGPLVGSATAVARIAVLVTEVGTVATTIADIVADKDSAPFAILGLILGSGLGGEGRLSRQEGLSKASAARRALSADDLAKYTDSFKEKDALIQKISRKGSCSK